MKSHLVKIAAAVLVTFSLFSFSIHTNPANKTVKCLIQTKNYAGEGAYIAVSLLNDKGAYEQTLYMVGDDEKWYDTLVEWWHQLGEKESVDAISGATITPGSRSVVAFEIPAEKIDQGYSIRFESAVEDQEYYEKDLEVALTSANLQGKFEGEGYIRYVRLIAK
ncbi:Predicted protein [Pustulibacterium marinum]|uniref:Flagellin biosynthesis protein FlgD n=1 Tax=Pustulibacterium marinum TaxID=1224947 RepID=A0A1I7GB82_9FLAO|nr:DUF2271 domain-containing protein [Pustulibacterium marinum]SFU45712.1 Predicted protein [Pustulibacterium marinum]